MRGVAVLRSTLQALTLLEVFHIVVCRTLVSHNVGPLQCIVGGTTIPGI